MKYVIALITCLIISLSVLALQYLVNPADIPGFVISIALIFALIIGWKYGQTIDIDKNKSVHNYLLKRFLIIIMLGASVFGITKGMQFYYEKVASFFLFRYAISSNKDKLLGDINMFISTDLIMLGAKQFHTKEYDEHYDKLRQAAKEMSGPSDLKPFAQELRDLILFANLKFGEHLKNAPDEAIINYVTANLKLYQYVNTLEPSAVAAIENRGSLSFVDFQKLNEHPEFTDLWNKKYLAFNEIYTAKPSISAFDENKATILYEDILKQIAKKYPEESIKLALSPKANQLPANQSSQIIMQYYDQCLQLPIPQCALASRLYLEKINAELALKSGSP